MNHNVNSWYVTLVKGSFHSPKGSRPTGWESWLNTNKGKPAILVSFLVCGKVPQQDIPTGVSQGKGFIIAHVIRFSLPWWWSQGRRSTIREEICECMLYAAAQFPFPVYAVSNPWQDGPFTMSGSSHHSQGNQENFLDEADTHLPGDPGGHQTDLSCLCLPGSPPPYCGVKDASRLFGNDSTFLRKSISFPRSPLAPSFDFFFLLSFQRRKSVIWGKNWRSMGSRCQPSAK